MTASANLDLVRSIYAAWERGDFGSVDWAHPKMEFVLADGLDPGSTGLAGMAEGWRTFLSAWDDLRVERVEEFCEVDGERVLVLNDFNARGKTSGLELGDMRTKAACLFHIRAGKVTKLVAYTHREHAFADLGLAPE